MQTVCSSIQENTLHICLKLVWVGVRGEKIAVWFENRMKNIISLLPVGETTSH